MSITQTARSLPGSGTSLQVKRISWPFRGLTSEILRMFVLRPHRDSYFKALGLGAEEMAAYQFAKLGENGGALFAADHDGRLMGLIQLVPEPYPSVILRRHIWTIRQLALAPEASARTAADLVAAAIGLVENPVEFMSANIPALDPEATRGLIGSGFNVVDDQVVAVSPCRSIDFGDTPGVWVSPMENRHLVDTTGMIKHWHHAHYFIPGPGSEADCIDELEDLMLLEYLQKPGASALVAEDDSGRVLGFIAYREELEMEEYAGRRLAFVEALGFQPGTDRLVLLESLLRHALRELCELGIQAVGFRVFMSRRGAKRMLHILRRIGFQIVATDLIMQRSSTGKSLEPGGIPWERNLQSGEETLQP